MKDAIRHLDKRFAALRPLAKGTRPPKGWLRAVRDALGMTTAQFARRLGVSQPRIIELEKSEVTGGVTLHTLQRAAEALGCRLVYALVPERPLAETVRDRAKLVAEGQLASVEHTMRLEDQAVADTKARAELRRRSIESLLARPARLWDEK
ncbi:MAG TPA: mobile mystery protein A [Xanthobacteraceae bacterium]|jgi:predicted DNA-binding mobile mystery protein A